MDLQLHVTGTFRNWADLRYAMTEFLEELSEAGKMLGPDDIELLRDPIALDVELEDAFRVDGLVGYDILFDFDEVDE